MNSKTVPGVVTKNNGWLMAMLDDPRLKESENIRIRSLEDGERSYPTLETNLPLVITPKHDPGFAGLVHFVRSQGDLLRELVSKFGGLLFRGFEIPRISSFPEILSLMGYKLSERYLGGLSPRHEIEKNVFTSTDAIDQLPLFAHNETTFQNNFPAMISFFCRKEPPQYGETPIFNCAAIYRSMPPDLLDTLIRRRIKYVRRYRKKNPLIPHRLSIGWQEMFGTYDKKELERLCRENGARCIWGANDSLKIETTTEPFIVHPVTGEKCFTIHLLNRHGVSEDIKNVKERVHSLWVLYGLIVTQLAFHFRLVPMTVSFGNGKDLGKKTSTQIRNAIWKHSVVFKWRQNDILILDNIKTAHGRMNAVQPRKILTAMGDMIHIRRTVDGPPDIH